MSYLPKSVLEEINFKTIIPSVTYGILVWGNYSQPLLNSPDYTHACECHIVNNFPCLLESSLYLSQYNWHPINYLYETHIT